MRRWLGHAVSLDSQSKEYFNYLVKLDIDNLILIGACRIGTANLAGVADKDNQNLPPNVSVPREK